VKPVGTFYDLEVLQIVRPHNEVTHRGVLGGQTAAWKRPQAGGIVHADGRLYRGDLELRSVLDAAKVLLGSIRHWKK
jgi:hypothetical protein